MRGKFGILMVIAFVCPSSLMARGSLATQSQGDLSQVVSLLESEAIFNATARYEVQMAMNDNDVVYDLTLAARRADHDPLASDDYLITWRLASAEVPAEGFQAYFSGHHYRFRADRLQEYHYMWDSVPFLSPDGGVQRTAQFVDLLPSSIAAELQRMSADSDCSLSVSTRAFGDNDAYVIVASQSLKGYEARRTTYIIDRACGHPLRIESEYNPGQIGEQSVYVKFSYPKVAPVEPPQTEEQLIALFPEEFSLFRDNNYRIESLPRHRMPAFSVSRIDGERLSHQRDERFSSPTIICLLDCASDNAAPTIAAIRKAVAMLPAHTDLVLAFVSNDVDAIEELVGKPRTDETILVSAKTLARDCGTSVYPTVIFVSTDGIVENVALGFNNSLAEDVIQMAALMK